MPGQKTVEEIAAAIGQLSRGEREDLLLRLAAMDGLIEDLEDVADLLRAAQESSRPFEEFLAELRAEGRDV